jgi:PD-(D/E)XK nuclease superfamily/Predicted AAA-ATPase
MRKRFNITGLCRPDEHYIADVSGKMSQIIYMIESREYFIINRPRQYGKTTALYTLADMLRKTGDYIVLNTSFEGIGDAIFDEEATFARGFVKLLAKYASAYFPEMEDWLRHTASSVHTIDDLEPMLTTFVEKTDKKVILMIDEVDKSSNNQLFVSFLAMLRNKYLERSTFKTFHSIILAGVHDVKSLKLKLRPDAEQKYNSPWNIASDFKVDMNLYPNEIKPMLDDYVHETGVIMDTQKIAERLFYYTSGYPFLVSKLCKMLDEDYKKHETWTEDDVDMAAKILPTESNANFDSLIKNLADNKDLYDWVYYIAIDGNTPSFSIHNQTTALGLLYGIFAEKEGRIVIHNRIYYDLLIDYMRDTLFQTRLTDGKDLGSGYKTEDSLDMEAIMLGFQTFMKKEYNKKDRDFLEKNGRLVFLAFIKPILNGSGYDFKEPQISEERRLDLVVTYLRDKFVVELKIWRGEKAHQKGLQQLNDYLDIQNLNTGYLLIFDHSEVKNWQSEWIDFKGKKILSVWV